jgi:cysteine desulfurase
VDLLTATAHKLGGPVGVGLLVVSDDVELEPLVRGGSQEGGLWPGTQNAMGAVGFAEAARRIVEELPDAAPRWREMRDGLAERLRSDVDDLRVHGEGAPGRLPNLLSVGIPGCDPSPLLVSLDLEGIAVSSGSACDSESASPSHVLEAMGVEGPASDYAVLRFSFGPDTSPEEVRRAGEVTARVAGRVRSGRSAAAPGGT